MTRKLSKAQLAESLRFGVGALAAAGHTITDSATISDVLSALQDDMSRDEYMTRLYERVMRA